MKIINYSTLNCPSTTLNACLNFCFGARKQSKLIIFCGKSVQCYLLAMNGHKKKLKIELCMNLKTHFHCSLPDECAAPVNSFWGNVHIKHQINQDHPIFNIIIIPTITTSQDYNFLFSLFIYIFVKVAQSAPENSSPAAPYMPFNH